MNQDTTLRALGEVPIFPLGTVLFPRGVLPLRVFERRYVDMVRECLREELPFGICRITRGAEVGSAAEHEDVGCLARIADCDMPQPGVLSVRAVGLERFRVRGRRVDRGLVRATIEPIASDPRVLPPTDYEGCVTLLSRVIEELEARGGPSLIDKPYELDSAGWIANRIAEVLPLPSETRQRLMTLDDPVARLTLVDGFLRRAEEE